MPTDTEDSDSIDIFQMRPPDWLPKIHKQADLGFHGFQPPKPHQEEDILSESNVKNGLVLGQWISAETYSARDLLSQSLHENAIPELEIFMSQIFARRNECLPEIPPWTFKLPSRVTLNETKRQAWFTDLANPEVPLHKLGKSVPHGAKGHDLLDLLQSNNVEIPRAIWLLRVFGGNETAGLRNKPAYNPTQYSVEWANLVTGYMKKLLTEIALPSAPRPGLNIKQTFKGVFSDPETRQRWISRFSYCLDLLHAFYSEGLVDNRTFLAWLVQQMSSCNLAQVGFVARLADEYLDGMLISRALTHPFVEGCLNKLSEIDTMQPKHLLTKVEAILKNILQRVCLALPDAFVSPLLWTAHSALVCTTVGEETDIPESYAVANGVHSIHESLYHNLLDIKQRCEAMLFLDLPARDLAQSSWSVSDVQVLNSITPQTDLESVNFILESTNGSEISNASLCERIGLLLVWSVTPLQYGDHRRYAVTTLLRQWKDKRDERALRRDPVSNSDGNDDFLQDYLFDWLDSSDVAGNPENLSAVVLLYHELIRHNLFSYTKYTQRLIARGDVGLSTTNEVESYHRNFLKWLPLHDVSSSVLHERRAILYGTRVRETAEELNEREIRKEIRRIIPELFGGDTHLDIDAMNTPPISCPSMLSATCFEQYRTVNQWLLPILRKFIAKTGQGDRVIRPYCIAVELMGMVGCYWSILEISLSMLQHSSTTEHVITVLDVFRQHRHVWTCMNVTKTITGALLTAHQAYSTKGVHSRSLIHLLFDMDNNRYLDPTERQQLVDDIQVFSHALHPSNDPPEPVPPVLPEILLLAQDTGAEAPSILANSLWYKYRTAPDWAWIVWDNTIASLRQIPAMIPDLAGRRVCALRYANFLLHVDQHLPDGFDKHVLTWLLGPGKHELPALSSDVWDIVAIVLLDLVLREALSTATLLQGLVYPAWKVGATVDKQQVEQLQNYLIAANSLVERLLLRDDGRNITNEGIVFSDLLDIQRLVTRRQCVFYGTHFPLLLANIPTLVSMEGNPHIPEDIRKTTASIRIRVCRLDEFRQGVYRDLDEVREAFEQPLKVEEIEEGLHESLVAALRLMFDNGSASSSEIPPSYWRPLSSLLSPWKRAATAVELQFALRQLGEDLSRDGVKDAACASLNQLGEQIFNHSFTAEEADFVAVIAKGAGPGVSGKFLNHGVRYISKNLDDIVSPVEVEEMAGRISRAGDILRLVALIVQPFRTAIPPLQLEGDVQDEIIPKICSKFEDMAAVLTDDVDTALVVPSVAFLARLLQFVLTMTVLWSSRAKSTGSTLAAVLTRLVLMHSSGPHLDFTASSLLTDTLYYVLDGIPSEVKALNFDPFRNYPDINVSDLPADMPLELRTRFRILLPYASINTSVQDLAHATRDPSGNMVYHAPVQNRPWEWTEFLGEHTSDLKDDDDELKIDIKNSSSLSLELFGARVTGGHILQSSIEAGRTGDDMRSLRDDLRTESVFQRDWRESRLHFDVTGSSSGGSAAEERNEGDETLTVYPSVPLRLQTRTDVNQSSRGTSSPSVSVQSRLSTSSFRSPTLSQSATRQTGSAGDVIDTDTLSIQTSASRAPKRKAMEKEERYEDDSQVVDNPDTSSSSRVQKKLRTKTAAKSRVKKR